MTLHLATAVLALATLSGATGDDPKPMILFDGKTLDGWKKADFFKAGDVIVDGGKIVMKAGPKMTGVT